MSQLTFHLFGAPRLQRDGAPVHIARRRAVACAIYLAVTGQEISRDALAALFWPESDSNYARADLRRTLHLLHQALGPERLVADQERVRFQRDANLWLDVEHFRRLLNACHDHGHRPQEICPECLPLLAAAVALYRDDFLTGFTLPDSPAFDRWQWFEGEQLRRDLASALARLVAGHTAQGEFSHAIAYARRWVTLDPLDEPAQRWLMQLYAWSGERSTALHQYRLCVQSLAQELDAEPEPATRQLEEAIRAGRLPPPAAAEQLGVVRGRSGSAAFTGAIPEGEDDLRVVTALCAGLCMPEHTDDVDTLVAQSEHLLSITGAACAPYGGRVERVPGGDVLAIFGLNRIHEDDAERAIRAGLTIQQAAQAQDLAVQVGINTGIAYCTRVTPAADTEALLMGPDDQSGRSAAQPGWQRGDSGGRRHPPAHAGRVRFRWAGAGAARLRPTGERLSGAAHAQPHHEGARDRGGCALGWSGARGRWHSLRPSWRRCWPARGSWSSSVARPASANLA
jgi:DNA-binding SARP family transcriptional activator